MPSRTRLARSLRQSMTPQEVKLWVALKGLRARGIKFRRQVSLGAFIVDFACFSERLVIEVDGGQHTLPAHARADVKRDAWLSAHGFRVHRVWNYQVDQEFDAVMDGITALLSLDGKGVREADG